MKTPDQERLLNDVLNEDAAYQAFRTELRRTMLVEVRRRRRPRHTKPLLAMAASLALALTLLSLLSPRNPNYPQTAVVPVVRSVALKPEQIVTTAKHRPAVVTVQSRNIEIMSANFEMVRTVGELSADRLTDEQLLHLFDGRAVALVSVTGGKKLVFLDEDPQREAANP
jgi:hypothetical protein